MAEESVHQVTSDEKDVNMAALVTTYLKINNILIIKREREVALSIDLKYFIKLVPSNCNK